LFLFVAAEMQTKVPELRTLRIVISLCLFLSVHSTYTSSRWVHPYWLCNIFYFLSNIPFGRLYFCTNAQVHSP